MRHGRQSLILALIATALSACAGAGHDPKTGLYAKPVGGAPATQNDTLYSPALRCLAARARERGVTPPRVAVGEIADLTGRNDLQTGRTISQGSALFAITALDKAGVPAVERLDRSVSEVERRYAETHMLSDTPERAGSSRENFRPVFAGEIAGSRYYVVGGVTELNFNLRSRGADVAAGAAESAGLAARFTGSDYVLNVAVDLRLIDTISQEVVSTASYQKQIVGREVRLGVFDFLNGNVFDLSGGGSALEPAQFAVRTVVERGLYDFAADLHAVSRATCLAEGGPANPVPLSRRAATPNLTPAVAPSRPTNAVAPPPMRTGPQSGPWIDPTTWRVRQAPQAPVALQSAPASVRAPAAGSTEPTTTG